MPRTTTPLFGFKPPFVNGGDIVVPVLTSAGEYHDLTATATTWQRIARAIKSLTDKPVPCESGRGVVRKPGGRLL